VYDHTHARHSFSQALQSGPISVVIEVYTDFLDYSSGVYIPNKRSGLVGYIQMRLIGYGATSGASPLKYWIGALVRARVFFVFHHARLTCFFADVGRVIR
jgi:Papain family cysteine protease